MTGVKISLKDIFWPKKQCIPVLIVFHPMATQAGIVLVALIFFIHNHIPILMVPSGGYSKESADIIGTFLERILRPLVNHWPMGCP